MICRAAAVFFEKIASQSEAMVSREVKPKMLSTSGSVIWLPQKATSWSSIDCASRMPPSAPLAIAHAAA